MTAPVLPPPTSSPGKPSEPPAPRPPRSRGAKGRVAAVAMTVAMLLTALLNVGDLQRHAQRMAYGWQRDAALTVTRALTRVSHDLWLDRPRQALDRLFGHERTPAPVVLPTPGGSTAPTPATRRPTAADPLRVYLGGDSVAMTFGQSFTRLARDTGVVQTTVEARYSTGLTRPDYFDWPARLAEQLAKGTPPEVVVVMFGANDVQAIMTPDGPAGIGTAAWFDEYRKRVDATMTLLGNGHVDVYWVGQPVMRSALFDRRISALDDVYAEEAARHPGITFVDTRPLFADAQGHYTAHLPGADGRPVQVRTADGVHLTRAGGDRLTREVLRLIGRHWTLPS